MKKILLSLFLFITSVSAVVALENGAREMLASDFGLNSELEIQEFNDALLEYCFLVRATEDQDDFFYNKVERFVGYMAAVPELYSIANLFSISYQEGSRRGEAVARMTDVITISNAIERMASFEQKYGDVIDSFLEKCRIPAHLFEF